MALETAKGTKDYSPEEKIVRNEVVGKLVSIFERYGFSPLDTPVLERYDVLSSKYAGGAEILKETFKLKDQGGRELGLRYDLTVPMCRYIAMNPTTKMPFKRYQIGEIFRDGPVKLGRMRQFTQVDVDVVGSKNMLADAECVNIAQTFFKDMKLDVVIEVNNRKVLDGVLDAIGVSSDKSTDVILAIDKLKKVSVKEIEKELATKGVKGKLVDELLKIFNAKGSNSDKIKKLRKIVKSDSGIEGLDEVEELFGFTKGKNVVFSVSLARGLAYYTGTVFEVFMEKGDFKSSLAAGGRYDKMIGNFIGNREVPAVGISFGLEPIGVVMKPDAVRKTVTQLYVIPIKALKEAQKICEKLRSEGLNVDIDLNDRGVSKNLDYASSYDIPYVLFVGKRELAEKKVKLRDMKTGKEKLIGLEEVSTNVS
jgi:histidyl-tRNA synthetase